MNAPSVSTGATGIRRPVAVWVLAANTLVGLALVAAAILRETPVFWRNVGGYPVFLRELVKEGFLGVLGLDVLLVAALSFRLLRGLYRGMGPGCLGLAVMLLQWLLLTATLGIALWNNLMNLFEGRPWHDHP